MSEIIWCGLVWCGVYGVNIAWCLVGGFGEGGFEWSRL